MKKILLVGLSLLMACPTFAKIKLPALVGSNMVLQREREVNLWGEASPSKKVTVTTSWDGRKYTTQSDSDGKWLLKVSTLLPAVLIRSVSATAIPLRWRT